MEGRRTIKIEVNVVIEQEDIANLLTTAFYGGITYWCPKFTTIDMKESKDKCYEEKIAEHLFNGGKVTFYEDEDESGIEEEFIAHTVGLDEFLKGIHQYLVESGRDSLYEETRSKKAINERGVVYTAGTETITKIDWGNIDANEADSMIQYICFGEIIYG